MRNFARPGRSPVLGASGMAATAHPLATLTARDVLQRGGNAVDAAIAASAVLAVVEPAMSGIGGDTFALVYQPGTGVRAYNGSGRSGMQMSAERLLGLGITAIDGDSPHSVTVPGAVEAWNSMLEDCGTLSLAELLEPSIQLAEQGVVVQPRIALEWEWAADRLDKTPTGRQVFLKQGVPFAAGDHFRNGPLAEALRIIAVHGAAGFYEGPVAEDIVSTLGAMGGLLTLEDLGTAKGSWASPVISDYRGYEIVECPPNGQGFMVSMTLNVLNQFPMNELKVNDAANLHLQIEASRVVREERDRFFQEFYGEDHADQRLNDLLSARFTSQLRRKISPDSAMADISESAKLGGDTTCVEVVDREGWAVSMMNSIYWPWGSGIVTNRFGIVLQNRGSAFNLLASKNSTMNPGGPTAQNQPPMILKNGLSGLLPGARPRHTILPAMVLKGGLPVMTFGVVGAEHQPGGQVRLVSAVLDSGLDVQGGLDLPRVFYDHGGVQIEGGFPDGFDAALRAMGHKTSASSAPLGAGQAIWIDHQRGLMAGGSDFRKDGCALAV